MEIKEHIKEIEFQLDEIVSLYRKAKIEQDDRFEIIKTKLNEINDAGYSIQGTVWLTDLMRGHKPVQLITGKPALSITQTVYDNKNA